MRVKHSCIFTWEKKCNSSGIQGLLCFSGSSIHFNEGFDNKSDPPLKKENGIDKFDLGLCLYPQVQTDGSASGKLKSKQAASTLFWVYITSYIDDYCFFPHNKKIVLGGSRSY